MSFRNSLVAISLITIRCIDLIVQGQKDIKILLHVNASALQMDGRMENFEKKKKKKKEETRTYIKKKKNKNKKYI